MSEAELITSVYPPMDSPDFSSMALEFEVFSPRSPLVISVHVGKTKTREVMEEIAKRLDIKKRSLDIFGLFFGPREGAGRLLLNDAPIEKDPYGDYRQYFPRYTFQRFSFDEAKERDIIEDDPKAMEIIFWQVEHQRQNEKFIPIPTVQQNDMMSFMVTKKDEEHRRLYLEYVFTNFHSYYWEQWLRVDDCEFLGPAFTCIPTTIITRGATISIALGYHNFATVTVCGFDHVPNVTKISWDEVRSIYRDEDDSIVTFVVDVEDECEPQGFVTCKIPVKTGRFEFLYSVGSFILNMRVFGGKDKMEEDHKRQHECLEKQAKFLQMEREVAEMKKKEEQDETSTVQERLQRDLDEIPKIIERQQEKKLMRKTSEILKEQKEVAAMIMEQQEKIKERMKKISSEDLEATSELQELLLKQYETPITAVENSGASEPVEKETDAEKMQAAAQPQEKKIGFFETKKAQLMYYVKRRLQGQEKGAEAEETTVAEPPLPQLKQTVPSFYDRTEKILTPRIGPSWDYSRYMNEYDEDLKPTEQEKVIERLEREVAEMSVREVAETKEALEKVVAEKLEKEELAVATKSLREEELPQTSGSSSPEKPEKTPTASAVPPLPEKPEKQEVVCIADYSKYFEYMKARKLEEEMKKQEQ